jgi:transcriptional regulator with XRE-family HTH domain
VDEELARLVGQRIRRLRLQEGNSLRRQAQLVGVSASALSALENCRGGMSLAALQRVGAHFGLSITDLLADTTPEQAGGPDPDALAPAEVFETPASTAPAVQRGEGTLYQLLGSGHHHALQPYLISFMPGGGYDLDSIGHAGEEFTYVLTGEIELILGDETYRLRQGDAIRFRTEAPHSFRNASQTGIAVIVGAATPPW